MGSVCGAWASTHGVGVGVISKIMRWFFPTIEDIVRWQIQEVLLEQELKKRINFALKKVLKEDYGIDMEGNEG